MVDIFLSAVMSIPLILCPLHDYITDPLCSVHVSNNPLRYLDHEILDKALPTPIILQTRHGWSIVAGVHLAGRAFLVSAESEVMR